MTAIVVKDIRNTRQRIDFAVAEVGGIRPIGHPLVLDSGLLHDLLHLAECQLLATLVSSLHPQGDDTGDHGGGHRGARHQAI